MIPKVHLKKVGTDGNPFRAVDCDIICFPCIRHTTEIVPESLQRLFKSMTHVPQMLSLFNLPTHGGENTEGSPKDKSSEKDA